MHNKQNFTQCYAFVVVTAAITADSVKNNEFLPVILIEGEPRNRQQELSSSESVKYFLIDHTN